MFTLLGVDSRPTAAGRLAMRRAQLAALGPSALDMTATQIDRRRRLEAIIVDLEAQVAEQLELPVDPEVVAVETDAGVEQVPMALYAASDLDADRLFA